MPVWRSWRCVYFCEIVVLVTRPTLHRLSAFTVWSSAHLHGVLVTIVALAREVSGGVAIHATRMA
jgi:hypothetical protein